MKKKTTNPVQSQTTSTWWRSEPRPIMTKEEVADYLRVSPQTVAELIRPRSSRILPHIKVGKYVRFRRADVEKYVSEPVKPR